MIAHLLSAKGLGLLAVSGLIILSSCTKVDAADGPRINERKEVQDFDKISYEIGGTLNYTQGNMTQVTVNTTAEVMAAIEVTVKNKTLHISRKSGYTIANSDEITFDVIDDDTYDIYVCGSGDVFADFDENYQFDEHNLKISGSGNITADYVNSTHQSSKISGSGDISIANLITSNSLAKISGSGDIQFGGVASFVDVEIHGSGNFAGFELSSVNADVFSCGSGNSSVRVSNDLDAEISGSGNISYKGYPNLTSSVSGSGNLVNAN